jgi:hypothetical protein
MKVESLSRSLPLAVLYQPHNPFLFPETLL